MAKYVRSHDGQYYENVNGTPVQIPSLLPATLSQVPQAGGKKSLGTMYGNLMNKLGQGMSNLKSGASKFATDYAAANNGAPLWNKTTGLDKIGKIGTVAGGAIQGLNAIRGFSDINDMESDYNSLLDDISSSAYANPMANMYLNNEQRKLLRDVQKGRTDDADAGDVVEGILKGIPQTLLNTGLGFATGGIAGAATQGIGSLVNSGIQGYQSGIGSNQAELEALYQTLLDAENDYNSMRRQNLKGAGLSRSAYNSLY